MIKILTLLLVLGAFAMVLVKMPYFFLVWIAMMIPAVLIIFTILRVTDKYK